jgi:hypothetical protein
MGSALVLVTEKNCHNLIHKGSQHLFFILNNLGIRSECIPQCDPENGEHDFMLATVLTQNENKAHPKHVIIITLQTKNTMVILNTY